MINVFISHNSKDKPVARQIAKVLIYHGIKPWIDEAEINVGDSLTEKIRDGLDNVDYVLALISKNSVDSEWVKREIDVASNKEIKGKKIVIIPVLVEKCDLPWLLEGKLYIDLTTPGKLKKNLPALIKRFDVSYIDKKKNQFTVYELNPVQVIEKIERTKNEDELIFFLENIDNSDAELFYRDTFILVINDMLMDSKTSIDLIVSLIEICKYCPSDLIIKIRLTQFLNRAEEQILQSAINTLKGKKNLVIQQKKILDILRKCTNTELERCIWEYFLNTSINHDVAKALWHYIEEVIDDGYNENMIKCMGKLYDQLWNDSILEKWYTISERGSESEKCKIAVWMCEYGFGSEGVYIESPKLRNSIRNILLNTVSDNDRDNAQVMVAMLTGAEGLFENRKDVWDKLLTLDEYSVLLTLEKLSEFEIGIILNSTDDINGLKKIVDSYNGSIKKRALDVISGIYLKQALDIISENASFKPDNITAGPVVYTIIKETNVIDYRRLFDQVKKETFPYPAYQSRNNLIYYGDYILGNIKIEEMISKIKKPERNDCCDRMNNQLLVEKLDLLVEKDTSYSGRIKKLIKEMKDTM